MRYGASRLRNAMLLTLLCAGCANLNGVSEFQAYDAAIDNLSTATGALADHLRVAEKKEALALIDGGIGYGRDVGEATVNGAKAGAPLFGVAPQFVPEHASYFSVSADPPLTAALVRSISALSRYNDALSVYAEGRGLEAATGSLIGMTNDLAVGATALGLTLTGVGTAVEVLKQGSGLIGGIGSRQALRDELKTRGEGLDQMLRKLRTASGSVFLSLTGEEMDALKHNPGAEETAKLLKSIRAERQVVAEWVLLVDLARAALTDLRAAVEVGPSLASSVTSGAELAAEARVRVEAIKRILAEN